MIDTLLETTHTDDDVLAMFAYIHEKNFKFKLAKLGTSEYIDLSVHFIEFYASMDREFDYPKWILRFREEGNLRLRQWPDNDSAYEFAYGFLTGLSELGEKILVDLPRMN